MVRGLARNPDAGIPEWWTDYARAWHRDHGSGAADEGLGDELARAVKRPTPWSRVTIGRFFRKDEHRITSGEIADALRALYPDLPPYMVKPGDLQEALELGAVHRRADARRAAEEDRADRAIVEIVDRAIERIEGKSTPDPSQVRRQTDKRSSTDAAMPGSNGSVRRGGGGAGGRDRGVGPRRS